MKSTRWIALVSLLAMSSPGFAVGVKCDAGPNHKSGATLLFPYFEVDLNNPAGRTTLLSVNNLLTTPILARVQIWTDWAIPALGFDLYLLGSDVQTINLRDVLTTGTLPVTGSGFNLDSFPGCTTEPPNQAARGLPAILLDGLRADLTGKPNAAAGGLCAGHPHGDDHARGYVTVDVVNRCTGIRPGTEGTPAEVEGDEIYFLDSGNGVAGDVNALWGDLAFVDGAGNAAQGVEAVALWADGSEFTGRTRTFYGRYSSFDGRDNRVPLASDWRTRFLNGGAFTGGTDFLVFRDTRSPDVQRVRCGGHPSWYPLPTRLVARDENAVVQSNQPDSTAFALATQRVSLASLGIPADFGLLELRLQRWTPTGVGGSTRITRYPGWVIPVLTANGRFSVGVNATAAEIDCFGPP